MAMAMGMPDLWVRVPVRLGADVPPCEGVLKASQMTFSFHTHGIGIERERREREKDKRKKSCGFRGCLLSCPKSWNLGRQSVKAVDKAFKAVDKAVLKILTLGIYYPFSFLTTR